MYQQKKKTLRSLGNNWGGLASLLLLLRSTRVSTAIHCAKETSDLDNNNLKFRATHERSANAKE